MDEQEIFNQIKELQKQRTSLKEQDNRLVVQIMELKDKLSLKVLRKDIILIMVYSAKSMILKKI